MKRKALFIVLVLTLAACAAPAPKEVAPLDVESQAQAAPEATPFPIENGAFMSSPETFALRIEELAGLYTVDAGTQTDNSAVLAGRADGEAYLEATGRIAGYRMQFNRSAQVDTPSYIVNVVNSYETPEGASLVLSREWHQDVWSLIDSGQLTQLPAIEGLDAEHLVWQDAAGTVGVEIVYRNLYILLTGPTDGTEQYEFFSNLAKVHLDWIKGGEQ